MEISYDEAIRRLALGLRYEKIAGWWEAAQYISLVAEMFHLTSEEVQEDCRIMIEVFNDEQDVEAEKWKEQNAV